MNPVDLIILIALAIGAAGAFLLIKKSKKKKKSEAENSTKSEPEPEPIVSPTPVEPPKSVEPPPTIFVPPPVEIKPAPPIAPPAAETLMQAAVRRDVPPPQYLPLQMYAAMAPKDWSNDKIIDAFLDGVDPATFQRPEPTPVVSAPSWETPGTGTLDPNELLRFSNDLAYIYGRQDDYKLATNRDLVRDLVHGSHSQCNQVIQEGSYLNPGQGDWVPDHAWLVGMVDALFEKYKR